MTEQPCRWCAGTGQMSVLLPDGTFEKLVCSHVIRDTVLQVAASISMKLGDLSLVLRLSLEDL